MLGPLTHAQDADRLKRVLVLNSTRLDDQFSMVWAREVPRLLAEGLGERLDFYVDTLDVVRFPEPNMSARISTSCV
jgi:hypothetical protein